MLLHLLKKDYLITKKYVQIMLAAAVLIPLFILWRTPEYAESLGFILSAIFTVFMLLQYIVSKEYEYPKAATLLSATPFPRSMMVLSKYVFCIIIYVICCLIFWAETFLFSGLGEFHVGLFLLMFLIISLSVSIYLPVQYKLGYEKTRFVFIVVFMASGFILPQYLKAAPNSADLFAMHPPLLIYSGMVLIGLAALALSAFVSVRIYSKADLA